jgi:Ni,Fe-hydrogenase III large subunit
MTTPLDKTLRRQIRIKGQDYVIALSPEGLKITLKGKRNGLELAWSELVSGEAALAVALNASVGRFAEQSAPAKQRAPTIASEPKKSVAPMKASGPVKRATGRRRHQRRRNMPR